MVKKIIAALLLLPLSAIAHADEEQKPVDLVIAWNAADGAQPITVGGLTIEYPQKRIAFDAGSGGYVVHLAPKAGIVNYNLSGLGGGQSPIALYFRINASWLGSRFDLSVPNSGSSGSYNARDIGVLETALATNDDEDTYLLVYVAARRAYRYWQGVNPKHILSVKSAKLWFDSAYKLAARADRPFRMDPVVADVLKSQEAMAKRDAAFSENFYSVVKPGYVNAMLSQVKGLSFQEASLIPKLVQSGDYDRAIAINQSLLDEYQSLTVAERRAVVSAQGINEKLLTENAAYLSTLSGVQ